MLLKSARIQLPLVVVCFLISGCGLVGNPTQGIAVASKTCLLNQDLYNKNGQIQCLPGSDLMINPYVPVWGNETSDYFLNGVDQTEGTIDSFGQNGDAPLSTGQKGVLVVNYATAPAYWDLNWLEPWPCGSNTDPAKGPIYQGLVTYEGAHFWWEEIKTGSLNPPQAVQNYYSTGQAATLDCYSPGQLSIASTRFAILGSLPNTLTLGSDAPLTTQYGMPLMYVYDKSGNVVATETATSVSSDGTQATFPFPSALPQSGYSLAIVNQTGSTPAFAPAGENLLSIASSQTISGNPFGVAAQAVTTTEQDGSGDLDP